MTGEGGRYGTGGSGYHLERVYPQQTTYACGSFLLVVLFPAVLSQDLGSEGIPPLPCWRPWIPSRTAPSPTTTWGCPSTCPTSCSLQQPTPRPLCRRRCWIAWRCVWYTVPWLRCGSATGGLAWRRDCTQVVHESALARKGVWSSSQHCAMSAIPPRPPLLLCPSCAHPSPLASMTEKVGVMHGVLYFTDAGGCFPWV